MAGDWIKMRVDLTDDPAVIGISVATGLDEFSVVGRLHKFWSWADSHTTNGNATVTLPSLQNHGESVSIAWIDRYLQATGFAQSLIDVGWLVVDDSGIHLPNFDRHNGQTAKQRALTSKRVAKKRSAECNGAGVTESLPEKRREEKREPPNGGSKTPRNRKKSGAASGSAAEVIYQEYPLKVGKPAALKAITEALKKCEFADLLASVREYAEARRMPDGSVAEYTPYPQKWFNQEMWNDDRSAWRPKSTSSHQRGGPGVVYDPDARKSPGYGKL